MANYPPLLHKGNYLVGQLLREPIPNFSEAVDAAQSIPNAFKNADLRNLSSCALDGFGVEVLNSTYGVLW